MIRSIVKRLLGERNIGRLQYLLKPELASGFSGPLNGQVHRRRMFTDIMSAVPFQAIVETGTFRGTTTAYFATAGPPVYSVEISPRNAGFAAAHLRKRKGIHLFEGDSPAFLRTLAKTSGFPMSRVFFYLDAHWEKFLPLADEIEIIFKHWTEAVVMVDDFQVPGSTYAYDDYGPGQVLNLEYVDRLSIALHAFFPAVPAEEESGYKRGSVVLCREDSVAERLRALGSLAEASGRP